MGITTTINPLDINNPTKEILPGSGGYSLDSPNSTSPATTTTTITSTTTIDPLKHSIAPASGFYGDNWPQNFVIPQGVSSANWTNEAKGYPQQTFLGASIRSFNMNGGFGDNSSSLTVELVVDEYNLSDDTDYGTGDDVYWSGVTRFKGKRMGDKFVPPIPGSPVFFKFGPNFATVKEAYLKTFDDLYNMKTVQPRQIPSNAGGVILEDFISGQNSPSLSADSYVALEESQSQDKNATKRSFPIKNYASARIGQERGVDHIVFGGILQTFTQSRSTNGNPLYTVQVIDPREILSNVTLILNDYSGPTYGQQNILNIYGFLEYNPTESTKNAISGALPFPNEIKKLVQKSGLNIGSFKLEGDDRYYKTQPVNLKTTKDTIKNLTDRIAEEKRKVSDYRMNGDFIGATASFKEIMRLSDELLIEKRNLVTQENSSRPFFPMTGTGFSRRGPQGIPYYRVRDSINALMEYQFDLPKEYKDQGFGGKINFRGYNYVVDFGSLPDLPEFYYFDFDQINLLELAMEICDITNKDLYVSLLPVIDHPAASFLYNKNQTAKDNDIIAGIIRIDTVDRSEQPLYGAVKTYIDNLKTNKIYVESQDLGYELSNITTDKFVVGAQEVGTYFFSSNNDRDSLAFRQTGLNGVFPNKPAGYQWTLECSLNQQILPYYGKLGNAVTIPKGFGAYQQILLDSSNLNAAGVGAYYVATEMELRCALISFDRWKEFLSFYNDTYMDSIEADDTFDIGVVGLTPAPIDGKDPPLPVDISDTYVVSVPRSVFDTYILPVSGGYYGPDGLPLSPCNPPYGYPLYYKRMTKIGIPEGGLTDLYSRWNMVLTNFAELQGANKEDVKGILNSQYTRLKQLKETSTLTQFEQDYLNALEDAIKNPTPKKINETIALIEKNVSGGNKKAFPIMGSMAKKNIQNALKVYNFVRGVAEECLGKKFLVRIPSKVNLSFSEKLTVNDTTENKITFGPFGFPPRSSKNIPGYEYSDDFKEQVDTARGRTDQSKHIFEIFMNSGVDPSQDGFVGGLAINYNPILEKYESNYIPTNIGGYFSYDLYQNTLGASDLRDIGNKNWDDLPQGVKQLLVPQDPTNFVGEDGRISPYVRFDHSENLSLEGFGDTDYSQQLIVGNAMIPDLSEHLDNTGSESYKFPSDPTNTNDDKDKDKKSSTPPTSQVLFVKCSVDESLHMPPKIIKRQVQVHAQHVKDIGRKSLPNKIFVPCSGIQSGTFVPDPSGCYVDSWSYYKAHYVPQPIAGAQVEILDFDRYNPADLYAIPGGTTLNNTTYVNSETDKLDTRFAYALITLPNRVVSTKDARLRDGFYQSVATERFKHLMTMDVVRDLSGFELPTEPPSKAPTSPLKDVLSKAEPNVKVQAWLAMKKAQSAFTFGFPYQINISSPSPIYPDLVSLPLLSKDRCYGPWISSQLDGQAYLLQNIGGRVDFIKDENLSPWNYGGYYLLNEAGRLQAEFSNSLLLFSERGSFTIASIPSGNSLCKQLMLGGPLVTSITVDISDAGCRTTYQMDLYTSSFGKLQKQKQDLISKIGRDRKRLISERNALIRKGLGKNQNRRNFGAEYSAMAAGNMPSFNDVGMGMMNAYTKIVASIDSQTENTWSSSIGGGLTNQTSHQVNASIQQDSDLAKATQMMGDQFAVAEKYQNAGGAAISDIWVPASYGYHPEMSYKPFVHENARNDLYINREQA